MYPEDLKKTITQNKIEIKGKKVELEAVFLLSIPFEIFPSGLTSSQYFFPFMIP